MTRLEGLMQDDSQLTITAIVERMRTCYGDGEVVTLHEDGLSHVSYGEVAERADRLQHALARLGVESGDRVGTFTWNNQRHLELTTAETAR